jgi:hypothetical protein
MGPISNYVVNIEQEGSLDNGYFDNFNNEISNRLDFLNLKIKHV